jgi:hypothetical protein
MNLTLIVFQYQFFTRHKAHIKSIAKKKSANCQQENNLKFAKELYETNKHVL